MLRLACRRDWFQTENRPCLQLCQSVLVGAALGAYGPLVVCGADGATVCITWPGWLSGATWGLFIAFFIGLATWQVRGEFVGTRDRVTALRFGPDGQLFSGAVDATVLVWDPRTAKRPPAEPK